MKTFPSLLLLSLFILLISCKKDKDPAPPSITLLSGAEFTPDGAVVKVGGKLSFGITVSASDANVTNFVVKKIMPDGSVKVVLDSGLNSAGFTVRETFWQSVEEEARWTFQVMDRNRLFATTALTIFKDPNSSWGGIIEYPEIIMGYQLNQQYGHYLDIGTGKVLFADSATMIQDKIDLMVYYFKDEDELHSPTFSSPGEQGNGIWEYYPELASWTTRKYTKWDISVDGEPIPVADFSACHNDSLLIVSYDDVWGKKKFKFAYPDVVIPFMTAGGKKGLVRVLSSDNDPAGIIRFSLKIQQ